VVQIDKRYPGQARRVMMALWGMLAQFSYTKTIIVVDRDIDPRNWDALLNLGRVAAQAGDGPRARRALGRFVAEAPSEYGREKAAAREMLGRLP
jgi:hypothetical protein